jgi:DNA-binding NarL/FixJ family response regulator
MESPNPRVRDSHQELSVALALLREPLVRVVNCEKDFAVCGEAGSADQAFKTIGRRKPDLVLVDITLPDASELEQVKEIRAVDRKIKLLVVSMHDGSLCANSVFQARPNGYIRKQGPPEELIHAICEVLAGRIYVCDGMG